MSESPAASRLLWAFRAAQVRLRFVLVLIVAAVVVGRWETLRTYWDRWVVPADRDPSLDAVSKDTEYFCPMDPGVLSEWPGKCSVCNMALVRRSKGDMTPLPNGVVARVHLTPNRIQLGGIQTSPIGFTSLVQSASFKGIVAKDKDGLELIASVEGIDRSMLVSGVKARVSLDPSDGRDPAPASFDRIDADQVHFKLAENSGFHPGERAKVVIETAISDREPFKSLPDQIPPLKPKEPRTLYVCHEHPDAMRLVSGSCPKDGNALMPLSLARDQRVGFWCPMHPKVTAEQEGRACEECGGMVLVPRVITFRPKGKVLAVPETAVIDTGSKRVVFVESMPGTFDAVEVNLGPRCGTLYPVVSGLEPGQKVATSGAFLIDAETRLNPALAAGYFGASRPAVDAPAKPTSQLDFSGLSASDRDLALAQKTCPVTKKPLGSMGAPIKISISGRTVFVCCDGCIDLAKDMPSKPGGTTPAHHP